MAYHRNTSSVTVLGVHTSARPQRLGNIPGDKYIAPSSLSSSLVLRLLSKRLDIKD